MGDVSKAINDYIVEVISLNRTEILESVRSREWFLKRLSKVVAERTNEPVLYDSAKFVYFGSYFKRTKVKDVDEYDVLVVIDSNTGVFFSGGRQVGIGLGSAYPNHKYDKKYYKSDNTGVSPSKLLNWLKGVVQEVTDSFGGEAPERNGQAITALIKSKNLKIDLVPAGIFERQSDETIFYNVPKGDAGNGWIITSPRMDIDLLNSVAKGKDNFRNVVRIMKRIKDTYNFLVSSFAVETAIVKLGQTNKWNGDLYQDLRSALVFLADAFTNGKIDDPYNNDNLIANVQSLDWYSKRLMGIVELMDNCTKIDDQDKIYNKIKKAFENE